MATKPRVGLYRESDQERLLPVGPRPSFSEEKYRSEWRRDFARLIHSPAFRRLQGKTQVFSGPESDFFRNRLTHSLEVAQIAKSIAIRLNSEHPFFRENPIDTTLVEIAGLAHDLGHLPFGHNGELALDKCMKQYGGFEGNAQTLRILATLEKKQMLNHHPTTNFGVDSRGNDHRIGLNLTYRSLPSIPKYDKEIDGVRSDEEEIQKGYYMPERAIVDKIKHAVVGNRLDNNSFKTIECSIMDLADDIAYSTYDMEDTLKGGFVNPIQIVSTEGQIMREVANACKKKLGREFDERDAIRVLLSIFDDVFGANGNNKVRIKDQALLTEYISESWRNCQKFVENGYIRVDFTSQLVGEFIRGVDADVDEETPPLSSAKLDREKEEKVEVLKHFTYQNMIMSSRMKVTEYRGQEIVTAIFKALSGTKGHMLLPNDFREIHERVRGKEAQMRTICDFIAGMTDRYALEFYGRLTSENAQTIFKPL
jgi:dGTPase